MHDAWFFVGVLAFIFLIWVATGGPTHPLAFSGPSLALPGALGGGDYLSLPRAPFSVGNSHVSLPGSSSGSNGGDYSGNLPEITGGVFGTPSPYRGIVTLNHNVSGIGSSNPSDESLEIRVSYNAGVPVDISGWRIISDSTRTSAVIPRGTEVPTSGIVNAIENIVLSAGDRVIIASGVSPIGASFKENKCIGYFSTFQKFSPSLPQNCPSPSDELEAHYGPGYIRDPYCIDYVDKLSRCQVALTPPPSASSACQSIIVNYFNYNGCVNAHRNDADFLGDTWRVYLGRTSSMFRSRHEIVKLLDTSGKTVDAFSY